MEKNKKIKLRLFKSIIIGLVIPIIGIFLVIDDAQSNKVWNELLLITNQKIIVKGYITKAEEFTQEIEEYDSRRIREVSGYVYDYSFILPDGKEIRNNSGAYGNLHLDKELDDIPFEIEVEYLANNPEVNRIKGLFGNTETLIELFRRRLLFGCIGLCVCLYLSFHFIKRGIKEYNETSTSAGL